MESVYFHYASGKRYDWVSPDQNRTPEEYPYSFSAHYLWREDDMKYAAPIYADRMWQWDFDKAKVAFGNSQRGYRTKEECKKIIESYYKGQYECVGYALSCNVSNGYEIGIFYVREL